MVRTRSPQALIAVGGRASRDCQGGIHVWLTKYFMTVGGRPLMYWNLLSMHRAGVRRLVLAYDADHLLECIRAVVGLLPVKFAEVVEFRDQGLGVHGLPFHAAHVLDHWFVFECVHSLMHPHDYSRVISMKHRDNIVVTPYVSHQRNPRQPVTYRHGELSVADPREPSIQAVAHPFVIDQEYAALLPSLDFDVRQMIGFYMQRGSIEGVPS